MKIFLPIKRKLNFFKHKISKKGMSTMRNDDNFKQLKLLVDSYREEFNYTHKMTEYLELICNYLYDNGLHIDKRFKKFNLTVKKKLIELNNEYEKFHCDWVPIMFQKLFNEEISST